MTKLRVVTSPSGARFTVADEYGDKFSGLVADLEAAGYGINPNASGGYNPRNIRGSRRPSNHAFGRAIDVNWDRNALGTKGEINPELARSLAAKHGMTWGGDWSRPDPMHFEIAGVPNVPVSQRGITRVAGVQKTQPMTTEPLETMPTYKNVGGVPVTSPQEVGRQQALAKALMAGGMDGGTPRHWSEALGNVLMSGVGMYKGKQAAEAEAQGQTSGNQALAQLLAGGDATAAVENPYSSDRALKYVMDQKAPKDDPSIVQTYKFRQGLPEADRLEFDKVQRAQQWQDLGTSIVNPRTGETYKKDLFGAERQKQLGDAQGKGEASWPKTELAYDQAKLQDQFVVQDIDTALSMVGPWTSGFAGSVGKFVAGSPQSDLSYALESIKANLAFDKLQAIRDASPTGGALGAVSERELMLLESAWGSIAQAQSEEQLKSRLSRLKQIKAEYAGLKKRAYEEDKARFGAAAVPNPQTGAPAAPASAPPNARDALKQKYGVELE